MHRAFSLNALTLAATVALLTACGGDGDDNTSTDTLRVGDEYTALVLVDGQAVQAETRKVFGVTADGRLTDDPNATHLDGALVSLITDADAVEGAPTTTVTDPATLQRFLADLWAALQARDATAHAATIWATVEDQDQGLADVYADQQRSGLTLAEWVDFYATIDEFELPSAHQGLQERELVQWLAAANVSQADLLRALAAQGLEWRAFLGTLQTRGQGFDDLRQRWTLQAPAGLTDFIAGYLAPAETTTARDQAKALADRWEKHNASGYWLRNSNIADHWRSSSPPQWHTALTDATYDDENGNHGRNGYFARLKDVTLLLCKEKRGKIGAWFYRNDCAKQLSKSSFRLHVRFIGGIIDRALLEQTEHYTSWGTAHTWARLDKVEGPLRNDRRYASMAFTVGVDGQSDTGVKHQATHSFNINGLDGIVN